MIIILEHADRDPEGLKSTYVKFVLNDGRTKVKNARGGMKWPEDKSTIKLYMNATFVK